VSEGGTFSGVEPTLARSFDRGIFNDVFETRAAVPILFALDLERILERGFPSFARYVDTTKGHSYCGFVFSFLNRGGDSGLVLPSREVSRRKASRTTP
jgi:hypothetical protein